jgi:DNA-binding XRE family transcriptional regulator
MTVRTPRSFSDWLREEMTDPEFRDAFEAAGLSLTLGMHVRQLRLSKGLSKRELAKLARVPKATISRIELGHPDLRLETVFALSKALGARLVIEFVPESA